VVSILYDNIKKIEYDEESGTVLSVVSKEG